MRFWKNFILPVSLLAGTIVGAGIFSLPYVFSRAGLFWSFLLLIVFTLVFCVVHLMYADLILKNGDRHRFAGFARIYFGEKGYWLSILGTVVEMFFVLVIYLVLSASFISLIFPRLPIVWGVIIFWWLGSLAIFAGTKRVALFEFLATAGILAVVALVAVWGVPQFLEKDFSLISSDCFLWLLPFGPLLFSLNGRPAVPSLIHYFNRIGQPVTEARKPIIWGTVIPALVYLFFVSGVIGLSGKITPDSISGVSSNISFWAFLLIFGVLGILSLLSSYFSIGLDVRHSLEFDLRSSKILSAFLIISLPLILFFLNSGSFLSLVEFAGGIFIGLEGIMILWMWKKSRKQEGKSLIKKIWAPFWWTIILVFVASVVYTIISRVI